MEFLCDEISTLYVRIEQRWKFDLPEVLENEILRCLCCCPALKTELCCYPGMYRHIFGNLGFQSCEYTIFALPGLYKRD